MSAVMTTASGVELDLRYPRVDRISLANISHHLAQINRFTGAARRPYSVAEHSLLVLEIMERLMTVDVHARLAGLMHDAHEAYTNDLSTPAKTEVADWPAFEGRLERVVRSAFALHAPAHDHRASVKTADLIALATERAQLLPQRVGQSLWPCLVHVQPANWVDLMSPERCTMGWAGWRDKFKDRVNDLDFERNEVLFKVAQP